MRMSASVGGVVKEIEMEEGASSRWMHVLVFESKECPSVGRVQKVLIAGWVIEDSEVVLRKFVCLSTQKKTLAHGLQNHIHPLKFSIHQQAVANASPLQIFE